MVIKNKMDQIAFIGGAWLPIVAFRVPKVGDIYLGKDDKLKRCKEKNYSKLAKKRPIFYSNFKEKNNE